MSRSSGQSYTPPKRAPYAADPHASRGRLFPEGESTTRNAFQRDHDRIIHASAFRRLKQKTQVFVAHEGDHFRTRLTHSLEVAQIARALSRNLGLDQDLAEAVALAHDLGHPPFGHAGEDALQLVMLPYGGFDHNLQTFRVLTSLEARYPAFNGLNLTWETLEGVAKHNGPEADPVPQTYVTFGMDLVVKGYASAEAQVAAIADDLAYNNHDLDDGLRAGLFTREAVCDAVPLVAGVFAGVDRDYPHLERERLVFEVVRRLIGIMVEDCLAETRRRLADINPQTVDDIRNARRPMVRFSPEMFAELKVLRTFLFTHMYRHVKVNRKMSQARRIVTGLFELFMSEPELMPDPWSARAVGDKAPRVVCDYIAGMTDGFAMDEHRRLLNLERWV
jgi:dGTPase